MGGKWPRNEADRGLTESPCRPVGGDLHPYRHGFAVPPPPEGEAGGEDCFPHGGKWPRNEADRGQESESDEKGDRGLNGDSGH